MRQNCEQCVSRSLGAAARLGFGRLTLVEEVRSAFGAAAGGTLLWPRAHVCLEQLEAVGLGPPAFELAELYLAVAVAVEVHYRCAYLLRGEVVAQFAHHVTELHRRDRARAW